MVNEAVCIAMTCRDTEFWDRELKEPALLYAMGRGRNHPSFVHQQSEVPAQGDRGGKRKRQQQLISDIEAAKREAEAARAEAGQMQQALVSGRLLKCLSDHR